MVWFVTSLVAAVLAVMTDVSWAVWCVRDGSVGAFGSTSSSSGTGSSSVRAPAREVTPATDRTRLPPFGTSFAFLAKDKNGEQKDLLSKLNRSVPDVLHSRIIPLAADYMQSALKRLLTKAGISSFVEVLGQQHPGFDGWLFIADEHKEDFHSAILDFCHAFVPKLDHIIRRRDGSPPGGEAERSHLQVDPNYMNKVVPLIELSLPGSKNLSGDLDLWILWRAKYPLVLRKSTASSSHNEENEQEGNEAPAGDLSSGVHQLDEANFTEETFRFALIGKTNPKKDAGTVEYTLKVRAANDKLMLVFHFRPM
ncbi:unnamed protein product [Amoebophrya sp. A25]|nr:unnamed protein product [Amoebophrya sp. A25]|eukprot:GSA25T00019020001.1